MKNKIVSITFLLIIIGWGFISVLAKDNELSDFERRKLAKFPKLDKNFSTKLDDYLLDQFVMRNELINLNSVINRKILNKIDNNDVYIEKNNIYEKIYPLEEKKIENFTMKINYIIDNYCENSNVYYSITPDKSKFLFHGKYLKLDYNKLYNIVKNNVNGDYIDITNNLDVEDYYNTDIHWKQENILDVAKTLVTSMGKEYKNVNYKKSTYNNFYGSLYSKAGTNIKPDILTYLYNEEMKDFTVTHLEYGKKDIYDKEKLEGLDAYDVFLSGASSYIEIENKNMKENNTLILFRDSFASSIAPLLTPYYNKIIMVDLRYIDFDYAKDKLDFDNADVLFLYSTLIINSGDILKVNIK